jgi:hypothetical protein
MGGNPAFRGTRVPVHMLAELVPSRACARTRYRRGSVDGATYHPTHFSGGLIYAPDEASWHLARAALLGQ